MTPLTLYRCKTCGAVPVTDCHVCTILRPDLSERYQIPVVLEPLPAPERAKHLDPLGMK
jgi:hypothetical protein